MVRLSNEERHFLEFNRSLTTDAAGQYVLVGLTAEETAWYIGFTQGFAKRWPGLTPAERAASGERYLALHGRMERARLQIIFAEADAHSTGLN